MGNAGVAVRRRTRAVHWRGFSRCHKKTGGCNVVGEDAGTPGLHGAQRWHAVAWPMRTRMGVHVDTMSCMPGQLANASPRCTAHSTKTC
eukprot:360291-Chlamydomonas_euryale.AAC.15